MTISLTLAIILALIAPLTYGLSNTYDKFIISKRVKNSLGITIWAGVAFIIFSIAIGLFIQWDSIELKYTWPVILAGIIWGIVYFIYYKVLQEADASNYVGLLYAYPILTAVFSFVFLGEVLSSWAYLGAIMSILGAIILSIRIKKINGKKVLFLILLTIIGAAAHGFLIKISTFNLPVWNGIAIEMLFSGLTVCSALISKRIRASAYSEIKNFKFIFSSETLTLVGTSCSFFAMSVLSATVSATISTLQPLSILVFERTLNKFFGKIHKDKLTIMRIISILLTIGGVLIITITGT